MSVETMSVLRRFRVRLIHLLSGRKDASDARSSASFHHRGSGDREWGHAIPVCPKSLKTDRNTVTSSRQRLASSGSRNAWGVLFRLQLLINARDPINKDLFAVLFCG